MYDVLVVGGGIAAFSGAITAAKKGMTVQVVSGAVGPESTAQDANGYPGFLGKDGAKLFDNIRKQAQDFGVIVTDASAGSIQKISFRQEQDHEVFVLEDGSGNVYEGRAVIVASGEKQSLDFLRGFCELNSNGKIIVNPRTDAASHVGVFAAGAATDVPTEEAVIEAGDGAKAASSCVQWLKGE